MVGNNHIVDVQVTHFLAESPCYAFLKDLLTAGFQFYVDLFHSDHYKLRIT